MNTSQPLVSICVPIYNVEKYIRRCSESLFKQTYGNLEFVFVDDCTPDNSVKILQETINEYPQLKDRVNIIKHEHNKGLAAARNTGVANAKGEFILWVDSDDYIDATTVEKLINLYNDTNADIVCYDIKVLWPTGRTSQISNPDIKSPIDFIKQMLVDMVPHNICGHLIKKSLYINHDITAKEGFNQAEDLQIMPRLAFYATKIATLHEQLYFYDRTSETSYSNNYNIKSMEQELAAFDMLEDFFKDKSEDLVFCVKEAKVRSLGFIIRKLSDMKDDKGYYKKELKVLYSYDKQYWRKMTKSCKIAIKLHFKNLVHLYNKITIAVKTHCKN